MVTKRLSMRVAGLLAVMTISADGGDLRVPLERLVDLEAPVSRWVDAIPLGNGQAGALVWGEGSELRFTLDRADYWFAERNPVLNDPECTWHRMLAYTNDQERLLSKFNVVRDGPCKLPGVRLVARLGGGAVCRRFTLNARNGSAEIVLGTPKGERRLVAWFEDDSPYLSLAMPDDVSFASLHFTTNGSFSALGGFPVPAIDISEKGAFYSRGNRAGAKGRWIRDFRAGVRFVRNGVRPDSAFWKGYWQVSDVALPDVRLQKFYDFAMYCYGATSRPGCAPVALQAVWTADNAKLPPWHGDYHMDLNVQETYWAAPVSGHLDQLDAYAFHMSELLPVFQDYARTFFRLKDGAAAIPGQMGYDGTFIAGDPMWSFPITHGLWGFAEVFNAWEFCPSRERLERIWPLGLALAKAVEQVLEPPSADGIRRYAFSCSPEIGTDCEVGGIRKEAYLTPNTTYDRAVTKGFLKQMAVLAAARGEQNEERRFLDLAKSLGPANVDGRGRYLIAPGQPLVKSHLHLSHLHDVFPYKDVDPEADALASVDHYLSLGKDGWAGHTFPEAACKLACVGRGTEALECLAEFITLFTARNCFHVNYWYQEAADPCREPNEVFTLEANLALARGVQEMLLGGERKRIRLFPAVPAAWKGLRVSFRDLLVPGGHRVSAELSEDGRIVGKVVGFSDVVTELVFPDGRRQSLTLKAGKAMKFAWTPEESALTGVQLPMIFGAGSTVLFQGDSITDGSRGGDMNDIYGQGYVWEIASRYQSLRPDLELRFANRGRSGDTSSNLVERWSSDAFPFSITEKGYESAFGCKPGGKIEPDYLSVLVGINDYFFARRKLPQAVSAEDYEANLRRLLAAATNANPRVRIVLCEPFRLPTDASEDFCRRQDAVAKLAAEFSCAFVPFQKLFSEDLMNSYPRAGHWFWDFFHPTPAAHRAMADFWLDSVARKYGRATRNTALEPRAKLEEDDYDWYARHARIVNEQGATDPEIVFIGDSITQGWECNDAQRGDACGCFKKWFGKYRTLNMGFGWDRIQNVLWRLSHGEMDGTKPRVVVIHIGTNNAAPGYKLPFPANTPEEIAEGIVEVCRRVREKAPKAKIVLMDVFPRGHRAEHWRRDVRRINASLAAAVAGLGDGNLVRLSLWDKFVGPDGEIPKDLMFDALHPTAKGYEIWAEALKPMLEEHSHGFEESETDIRASLCHSRPAPRAAQLKRIREGVECYGIVHWGLNTYADREWGFGDENPDDLDPSRFDADQIVGACKAGGLQGLIVVAKHHDGFCLWPTKTTEHNISRSPFRNGRGNYVKEMELACRRQGLRFGVYVSPWDRNNAAYGSEKYVKNVFQQQIRELLSGDYGEIFEMWFDGANGGDGFYGGARESRKIPDGYYRYETETFELVRRLQPDVCIFNELDAADFRFCGNEQGLVNPESRSTGGHYDDIWENYMKWANSGLVDGTTFHPVEADFPLRPGWFYHASESGRTKNAAYLMKRYLNTVGNSATMNLGIAPSREGRLDDEDVKALSGFGQLKKLYFSQEVPAGKPFNVVVMKEDVSKGERVDAWRLVADGKTILAGKSIGIKRIRVLETPVCASTVFVRSTSSLGPSPDVALKCYWVDPGLLKEVSSATTESGETDTAKWMTNAHRAEEEP